MIEGAGGVVWRTVSSSYPEVLVVHRARQRDWSLPKGKLRRQETAMECALREVHEETGFRCTVHAELSEARFLDRKGRPRRVRYWSMQATSGYFRPSREVDEARWLPWDRLGRVLSYEYDLSVVASLLHIRAAWAYSGVDLTNVPPPSTWRSPPTP
ncbi:MAG: NUDIX hydrolase [Ilumatobacteraceae bacterium]